MLNYVWTSRQICTNPTKTITVFDAVMDEAKKVPVRVFVIDEKDKVLKISIFFQCKENEITDTHISWVLGDITEKIGYDPNVNKRMMHWVASYIDKAPDYLDNYFYQI